MPLSQFLTVSQTVALGLRQQQAGRLTEAEALFRQVLGVQPGHPECLRRLGLIAGERGDYPRAIQWMQEAVSAEPRNSVGYCYLGAIHHCFGRLAAAITALEHAVELNPGDAEAFNSLGICLADSGSLSRAENAFRQALAIRPGYAEAYNNLGIALSRLKRGEEAVSAYSRAIELRVDYAEAFSNLGSALLELGCAEEAEAACRRSIQVQPSLPEAHYNLGNALASRGELAAAIAAYTHAIQLRPGYSDAHDNLGTVLADKGRWKEAIAAYHRALELNPNSARTHGNLGNALHGQGKLDEAICAFRKAISLPDDAPQIFSNYLSTLQYWTKTTAQVLQSEHEAFDRRYAQGFQTLWPVHLKSKDPERPLRVGFISPHFRVHPVGIFLAPLLANFDRDHFHVICYDDGKNADEMTARLRNCANEWHTIRRLPDEQLAQKILEDRIDILFDLAGHTPGNRLLVFARKPAPIQITWLDYVGTTGLRAIDYILADPQQIPPGADRYYAEKILLMPEDYICFDPPSSAPAVGPSPAIKNGFVTFGSFNIIPKTSGQSIEIWSRILNEIPRSRLLLKNRGFDSPAMVASFRQQFARHSIEPHRIDFEGWSPRNELLNSYNRVDIALDTFPYNGGLTTCEALWMGVPVITCPGEIFAGRHGLSHLHAAGLTETIAHGFDDYVKVAVKLAADLEKLSTLRQILRSQVAASPLCDGARFATDFSARLRQVWRQWCASR